MSRMTKRRREIASKIDQNKIYSVKEAVDILKAMPPVKFDQSVDFALKLGIDSRKSDQGVRGTVQLPSGTGKTIRILVLARGEKIKEAQKAGADFAGADELIEKIAGGWTDYDVVIATPDMMRDVGKLGKVLGPRGLMPTPKAGTVTNDVTKAIQEAKAGKIEFKADKFGVVNCAVGKLSFSFDQLKVNIESLLQAVFRSRPATVKGQFMQSLYLSSTMGPGIKIDPREYDFATKG